MKVVLFCGGLGMRLRGYADDIPKPMVTIGSRPIIWHLMKYYAHWGHKHFILCLGYKGNVIKDYFLNYDESESNDFVWSKGGRSIKLLNRDLDDWTITFVQTGLNANIGERLKAVQPYLAGEKMFLANYSDGISDLPLNNLVDRFTRSESVAGMLLVKPRASLDLVTADDRGMVSGIRSFADSDLWVNGGFFMFRQEIFNYIEPGDELVRAPFARLVERGALMAHKYDGFWGCMDTFKDKQLLEDLDQKGEAPWKVWKTAEQPAAPPAEWAAAAESA
jgi:glucose-1-phosphate cytidylyltransferase